MTEAARQNGYLVRFWVLACGYTCFKLANCMFCGPMGAVIPELVPVHQQTASGGWMVFWGALSGLAASALGYLYGEQIFSANETYLILGALNIAGLVLGILAFGAKPGCCELEAPPPVATEKTKSKAINGCAKQILPFLNPFLHIPFTVMFAFLFLQTIAAVVFTYFLQYYLADTVKCSEHGFRLVGFGKPVVESAEAATALLTLVLSVAQVTLALLGDPVSQLLGKRVLIAATALGQAVGFGAFGYVQDFSLVVAATFLIGASTGIGNAPIFSMMADAIPNKHDGGKDINLLITATAISQIVVPPVCGWALDTLRSTGGIAFDDSGSASGESGSCGTGAYRMIWTVAACCGALSAPMVFLVSDPRPSPERDAEHLART